MCSKLHYFHEAGRRTAVALPFSLETFVADWTALQQAMIRKMPSEFSRDEWAYLISFVDAENLMRPFRELFGQHTEDATSCDALARPRGTIAVWLPSNVSLLGPLTLILLSLTGNSMKLKASSRGNVLTAAFLDFARANLTPGPLEDYLCNLRRLQEF